MCSVCYTVLVSQPWHQKVYNSVRKNNKNTDSGKNRRQHEKAESFSFSFPQVTCMDALASMGDDEMQDMYRRLDSERLQVIASNSSPVPWEEELAYLIREAEIRRERRSAHQKYCNTLQEESRRFFEYDEQLPEYVPTTPPSYINFN